jgi:hypothetical protein
MTGNPVYKIIKKVDLPHTQIELRNDGIIQFYYGDYVFYNMEKSQEVENIVAELTREETCLSLRIAGKQTSMALSVMKYLSRGRGCLFTLADAFVIKSFVQRILAKIYIIFNKPYVPTRFFSNVNEAESWLKSLNKVELKKIHKLKLQNV